MKELTIFFFRLLKVQPFIVILLVVAVSVLAFKLNEHDNHFQSQIAEFQLQITEDRKSIDSLQFKFIGCMVVKNQMYQEILKNREINRELIYLLKKNDLLVDPGLFNEDYDQQ